MTFISGSFSTHLRSAVHMSAISVQAAGISVAAWSRSGALLYVAHGRDSYPTWWGTSVNNLVCTDNGKFGDVLTAVALLAGVEECESDVASRQPAALRWSMQKVDDQLKPEIGIYVDVHLRVYVNELSFIAIISQWDVPVEDVEVLESRVLEVCASIRLVLSRGTGSRNPLAAAPLAACEDDASSSAPLEELCNQLRRVAVDDLARNRDHSAFSSKQVLSEQVESLRTRADLACSRLFQLVVDASRGLLIAAFD